MKALIPALAFAFCLSSGHAVAQPFTPNEAGVTMGHWHLNSRDVEANKNIFVAMGGKHSRAGDFDVVTFPGVVVMLHLRERGTPPTGGTMGTVVNHVGFTVQNVQDSIAKWKAAGVPVAARPVRSAGSGLRHDHRTGCASKSWRTRASASRSSMSTCTSSCRKMRSRRAKPGTPSTSAPRPQRATSRRLRTFRVRSCASPRSRSRKSKPWGRVLDHIGFDVKDLKGFIAKLEAAGIKMNRPFTPRPGGGLAFIIDPWGTYIELNERPNPVYLATQ